jgi:uncharacterized protein (TIGR02186 family)
MPEVGSQKSEVRNKLIFLLISIVVIAIAAWAGEASAMLTARANHDHITVDFFYHGSTVSVRGISEPGTDLVIKMTSPEGHQVLKKKGKVAGALWMNVGQLKFEKTPNFYEVFSTRKLEDILSKEEMEKYVIGYPALEKHVEIAPAINDAEKETWFNEFVKFKEDSRLYASSFGKIEKKMTADGKEEYYILTDWPYQAAPGDYLVTVYAVKDHKVVEQAEARVNVEQVGIVKSLAGMAKDNAAVYGLLSIGVALSAGFGVGMVFRKGGGSH